jgi:hypothetical protein
MLQPQYFRCADLFSDLTTYLNMIHYFGQPLYGLLHTHTTQEAHLVLKQFCQMCDFILTSVCLVKHHAIKMQMSIYIA